MSATRIIDLDGDVWEYDAAADGWRCGDAWLESIADIDAIFGVAEAVTQS